MTARKNTFDRVRPRTADDVDAREMAPPESIDADGKRALFSQTSTPPAFGAVAVECSSCGKESVLTPTQLLRASFPSVHLPLLKKGASSWLKCPACGRRTWVKLHVRL